MSSEALAPILLFVFNRPWHTEQTLRALKENDLAASSVLYVYCDGPKHGVAGEDLKRIEETRRLVKSNNWSGEVHVIESESNKGLRESIVEGTTEVVNRHGRVIVLEDDVVVEPWFLRFMNEALALYEDDEQVMQVSGGTYDADLPTVEETYFLRVMYCCGWATWKRAWAHYNDDALDHLTHFGTNSNRSTDFDVGGSAIFMEQLRRNVEGRLNTWAVRWYASWLRAGGLALFPPHSLVRNIGFDGSGVHCLTEDQSYLMAPGPGLAVKRVKVVENQAVRQKTAEFFREYWPQSDAVVKHPEAEEIRTSHAAPGGWALGRKMGWALGRKIARRILSGVFPDLKILWEACATGELSLLNVVSQQRCVRIGKSVRLSHPHRFSWCIIGDYTYISKNANVSYTEIGKFCSIGPDFQAGWGVHPIDGISTSPSFYSPDSSNGVSFRDSSDTEERKKISIGNDVFIGRGSIVLDGVSIGDGAVVGAGCVVSKDVPPYAVVVGSPMKVLRYRFSPEVRELLQKSAWWDWSEERLKEVARHQFDVDGFVEKYRSSFGR